VAFGADPNSPNTTIAEKRGARPETTQFHHETSASFVIQLSWSTEARRSLSQSWNWVVSGRAPRFSPRWLWFGLFRVGPKRHAAPQAPHSSTNDKPSLRHIPPSKPAEWFYNRSRAMANPYSRVQRGYSQAVPPRCHPERSEGSHLQPWWERADRTHLSSFFLYKFFQASKSAKVS